MRTILGVCGGVGLPLFPFKDDPSFSIVGNIEPRRVFKTPGNIQWRVNFKPGQRIFTDWVSKGEVQVCDNPQLTFRGVDVIMGAPDCGHSSILGLSRTKKHGNPKENQSLSIFIAAVQTYQPKIFLMENLPALLKTYGKEDLKAAFNGYKLRFIIAPVSDFGNSQIHRKRLLIIGAKKRKHLKAFERPQKQPKLKTCRELLADLPKEDLQIAHVREPLDTDITMYGGCKLTARYIREMWQSEFKDLKRWPVTDRKYTSAPGVYRNRKQDYPATARKASRQYNHAGLMMSPRELARIMGAPDDFKIHMEPDKLGYWINKGRLGITKGMPYEIGVWFKKCLKTLQHGKK